MKFFSLCLLLFMCLSNDVFAQIKVSDKAVIKTPGVSCDLCKDRVEFFVSKEYGVSTVRCDIRKKTTTVTWLTDRTNLETIKVAIANLGFDADDIEAEETAYQRLPKECKRPEEKPKTLPSKG
jgi:periplasmic mercuric ion binding protein